MQKKVKFCPRCGAQLNLADAYCIRCGYNFKVRHKKLNISQILIIILVLAGMWIAIRLLLKRPIIPTEVLDFVNSITKAFPNKTR